MAGSYRHITKPDGSFRGMELIDDLGDAHEALEQCHDMIAWLTGGDRRKIHEAWLNGHVKKRYSDAYLRDSTYEKYWEDFDEEES